MISTSNMGLTAWDDLDDSYVHTELANNFIVIDGHDHTPTKGLQIPSGGLADNAVTTAKITNANVTTAKLADESVTTAKLALGPKPLFLGAVAMFWRPNTNTALPDANNSLWRIADGSSLEADEHDFPGGGVLTLPDWRNRFILGATTSGGGESIGTPPAIGQLGGAHTKDLSHEHIIDGTSVYRHFNDDRDWDEFGDILIRNRTFTGWPWGFWWWGSSVALSTDVQGATTQDIRPQYVGLLLCIQVKES